MGSVEAVLYVGKSGKNQSKKYFWHYFSIPSDYDKIELEINFTSEIEAQIPLIVFDSTNNIRYFKASEGFIGNSKQKIIISRYNSSIGGIDGIIEKGLWKIVFF